MALLGGNQPVPIREISEKLNISFHFLTKVFQKLTKSGVVRSMRGARGGIKFSRKPENIPLMRIVLAIDGSALFDQCILGLPGCGVLKPCPLHDRWFESIEILKKEFNNTSIAMLAHKIKESEVRITDTDNFILPEQI